MFNVKLVLMCQDDNKAAARSQTKKLTPKNCNWTRMNTDFSTECIIIVAHLLSELTQRVKLLSILIRVYPWPISIFR